MERETEPLALPAPAGGIRRHFERLWRGEPGLWRLVFVHMAVYGTLLNLATLATALLLFANDVPTPLALVVYFLAVPYNVFLLVCVWRASQPDGGRMTAVARPLSVIWFLLMALI